MKSTNTLTKEDFDKKRARITKELDAILKSNKQITHLSEDQRFALTEKYGKSTDKDFEIKSKQNLYYEIRADESMYDCRFYNLNDFNNLFSNYLSNTIVEAQKWVEKNNLVYINCGLDDFNTFVVCGYVSMSDKQLIEKYTKSFKEEQNKKQQEKIRKEEANKIITVNNKKYKLVEEFSCDCECGCDCWNGHCDCGCVECT